VKQSVERILVVTDPYYSRRASIFFDRWFSGSGIDVVTVNSGNYRNRLPPTEHWWLDTTTLSVIMRELGKIVAFFLSLPFDPG